MFLLRSCSKLFDWFYNFIPLIHVIAVKAGYDPGFSIALNENLVADLNRYPERIIFGIWLLHIKSTFLLIGITYWHFILFI